MNHHPMMPRIKSYANQRGLQLIRRLGVGQDGVVWETLHTAVKCLEREQSYLTELQCYQLLEGQGITQLGEFNVPRLMGHDDDLFIVEMDVVNPPHVLDFGKAYIKRHPLDRPHPYSDEDLERFLDDQRQAYWDDPDWPRIRWVINALDDCGICYFDVKPGNIALGHLAHRASK